MKKRILAALVLCAMLFGTAAFAEDEAAQLTVTTKYRCFHDRYKNRRDREVSYYDNVFCGNHGIYDLTPFDSKVPEEYFVVDEEGYLAVSPLVMDITDEMRKALYGGDVGDVAMYYGQYCEITRDKYGRPGFTGVHEGIDFVYEKKAPIYAIMEGVVTRAGDSNGTVGIYNEDYDITLLYLHCQKIDVRRGDVVTAGTQIASEGKKKASGYYTHVEMRKGRHTSSNPYRNSVLESDCPYAVMQQYLNVEESGRMPITYAGYKWAERSRFLADAAAETAAKLEAQQPAQVEETPDEIIELLDTLPTQNDGYGFGDTEATEEPAEPTPAAPEATLPPSGV